MSAAIFTLASGTQQKRPQACSVRILLRSYEHPKHGIELFAHSTLRFAPRICLQALDFLLPGEFSLCPAAQAENHPTSTLCAAYIFTPSRAPYPTLHLLHHLDLLLLLCLQSQVLVKHAISRTLADNLALPADFRSLAGAYTNYARIGYTSVWCAAMSQSDLHPRVQHHTRGKQRLPVYGRGAGSARLPRYRFPTEHEVHNYAATVEPLLLPMHLPNCTRAARLAPH